MRDRASIFRGNGQMKQAVSRPRAASAAGFTLIELMIVVVIIGVIAAIAYPSYQRSVRESNRSEAHAALTTLAALQERFFSNQNSYGNLGTTCITIDANTTTEHGYYTISVTLPSTPTDGDADCAIDANHAASYTGAFTPVEVSVIAVQPVSFVCGVLAAVAVRV